MMTRKASRASIRRPTVFEVTEISVESPLRDGADAWTYRRAIFTSLDRATAWVRERFARVGSETADYPIHYWTVDELVVDTDLGGVRTWYFDEDGSPRGERSYAVERLWGGRDPSTCRYKRGDLVGFVDCDKYRIGVVLYRPPSPADARRLGDIVTLGDDRYLVGTVGLDAPSDADRYDHEHVTEPSIFPAPADVDPELRRALEIRNLAYGLLPAPGS
ncbi:MAG: hypothetical protein ACHREM_04320 [Polyangiales bacterium]